MKCFAFLSLVTVVASAGASAQDDALSKSFFPLGIGDRWRYEIAGALSGTSTLTRDSMASGSRFVFFDARTAPAYEIDSLLDVYSSPTEGAYRMLMLRLRAVPGEHWIANDTSEQSPFTRFIARVDDQYIAFVLDTLTQVKRIGYYFQPVTDTAEYSQWYYDFYFAAGLGLFLSITDASQVADFFLLGCVIDGRMHGQMTSVSGLERSGGAAGPALLEAYPNPFNPSTTITYALGAQSHVTVKVFNVVGEEVVTIVDDEEGPGKKTVTFDGSDLPSGMYVCRLWAGGHSAARKVLLIR